MTRAAALAAWSPESRKMKSPSPFTLATFPDREFPVPLLSPWSVLFLSAALLWPPATRRWAPLALAVAYAWAGTQGALDPAALAAPALLALAALLVQPPAPTALRLAGHMLFIAVAAALFLHLMPGFHNQLVIPRAPLSPDAVPFSMYLNLDKPLVAFWIILALPPVMTGLDAGRTLRATLACGAAAVLVCLTLALALGMVGWAPKWPDNGWLWLVNNALLVTLAEEALFRGYIQERLGRLWRARRWGADAALLCAAALFGLAHYAGGWQWMLLAGLAGAAYGLAYRHGGLAAAVLAHLALNTAHFGLYTYPMRAAF